MLDNIWVTIVAHVIVTFLVTVVIGLIGLPILKKIKASQYVRDEGPASHAAKTGTPTMGGWFFIIAILLVSLLSNAVLGGTPESIWFYVVALLMYAIIGFSDDYLKVVLKRNMGLTSIQKLCLQIVMVGALFFFFQSHFADASISFIFFEWKIPMFLYVLFAIIWFVGFSNATNVTDGLDGLLGTTGAIAFLAFGIVAIILQSTGTAIFCFIVFGALLGFLVFNKNPAKVFMGDTGSLALGALLAAISIELNVEALLLVIGIVFVIETLSVMMQVTYFKYTKKKYGEGKRIFLMSPFHHHLELKGISEKIVVRWLSLLGIIGGIIGVMIVYFCK